MISEKLAGTWAAASALLWLVVSPLLAIAYLSTEDGAASLEVASVRAWYEPAHDFVGGLMTFGPVDRVYNVYTLLAAILFVGPVLCAIVTRRTRPDSISRYERISWRIALVGVSLFSVGIFLVASIYVTELDSIRGVGDALFLILMLPGMLLMQLGFTCLGIALLRGGFAPRAAAWLLAVSLPFQLLASVFLGHNSLGFIPILLAWGLVGWRLTRPQPEIRQTESVPRGSPHSAPR